jgi:hypothetical protein
MLRGIAVGPDVMRRAERLFRPPAIFAQPCAHEQARLASRAATAFAQRDARAAESLYARHAEIDAQDPEHALALGRARLLRGDAAGAAAAARAALERAPSSAWRLLGDAAWLAAPPRAHMPAEAESAYAHGRALAASSDEARAYEILERLRDDRDGDVEPAIRSYLIDASLPDAAGLALLATARAASPESALPRYLLGRRLLFADAPEQAGVELEAALAIGGLGQETGWTARELLGRARLRAGDAPGGRRIFEALLADAGAPEWRRLGWDDWRRRCQWASETPP